LAKKDENKNQISKNIMSKLWSLRKQMAGVYRDTYSTDITSRDELDRIGTDIEDNISKILSRNNTKDVSNISQLYSVANLKTNLSDKKYTEGILSYFEDSAVTDQLLNSYLDNKWVVELDREIDVVCKYMPKMVEALDAIKDSVLTADNFDKEYLTFQSPNIGSEDNSAFIEEIESIKKTYQLYDRVERWYDNTSKYGEQFVYKVPYKKALSVLLNRRKNTRFTGVMPALSGIGVRESSLIHEGGFPVSMNNNRELFESYQNAAPIIKENGIQNIKLEIVKDSLLISAIEDKSHIEEMTNMMEQVSFMSEASSTDRVIDNEIFDVPKNMKKDTTSQEGIIGDGRVEPDQLKVPGLLLKELKHENIIMLYMDDICLGYYYLEFMDKDGVSIYQDNLFQRKSVSSVGYSAGVKLADEQNQQKATDDLLRYLSSAIVANLDDKFINNNPYLKKEIYSVLKYNDMFNGGGIDRVRVTYLAPNDVEHIMFKEDPDTHRGISDIVPGLIPAKMWCCLYIANTIGMLTRGQDKRVYYVKQNVEQNIAQTLLNVINQIKKQNMNIMQIENMNSILGITGKFNDYIIPVGPSGDPPIQMEVMQGQEIDPQTEFMDKLEETAINATGIPIELVTARLSLDFATQLTMSNSKFLRFVFKRQSKFETHIGNIMTDIYNTEYEKNNNAITIKCVLPAPLMLNINNLNQIIDLISQQADTLATIEYPDTNDEDNESKKAFFKKEYVHYKLGSYIKQNEIDMIKAKAEFEFNKNKPVEDNQ